MNTNLEALVKKIKLGDDEAFPKLYNLTYRQIFFVIIPITKNQALAEDIVQDTYLKFLKKIDDYKAKNVLSYLITIAKNMAINEYNRLKRVTKVDDFDSFSYCDFIEFKTEAKEAITKALAVLDNTEKNIFLLHVLENLTHKEISLIIDKPSGTVSWLYARAIKKMKAVLKGDNYEY